MTSKCCNSKVKVDCADEGTCCHVCEKCGQACDVKPTIAERFQSYYKIIHMPCLDDEVRNCFLDALAWLKQQPENNPQNYFTIEQVEAIAREAFKIGFVEDSPLLQFHDWWQQKKESLIKKGEI